MYARITLFGFSVNAQWAGSILITLLCWIQYKNRPPFVKALGLYGFVSVLFQLAQFLSITLFGNVGLNQIGNAYTMAEALTLCIVFYAAVPGRTFKKGLFALAAFYILFYAVVMIFHEDQARSRSVSGVIFWR